MKTKLLILFAVLFSAYSVSAQPFSGGDMFLEHVAGNDYRINVVWYRDCTAVNGPVSLPVALFCPTNPSHNFTVQVPYDSSGVISQKTCAYYSSPCNGNNNGIGIDVRYYSLMVNLPPNNQWYAEYHSGCRHYTNNLVGYPDFTLYAKINNSLSSYNSSPRFSELPIYVAYANTDVYMNLGAYDIDGDSLSYSFMAAPNSSHAIAASYVSGYSDTNFTGYSSPATIDPITGQIWCRSSNQKTVVMVVCVKEWRKVNGVYMEIGEVHRDIEMKFIYSNFKAPVLSGMTQDSLYNTSDNVFVDTVCVHEQVNFNIHGFDTDNLNAVLDTSLKNFSISWNQGISGASFTISDNNTNHASANFQWTPGDDDIQDAPHCFTVTVHDRACNFYATNVFGYCIVVKGAKVNIVGDDEVCRGDTIMLVADTDHPEYYFEWETASQIFPYGHGVDTIYIDSDLLMSGPDLLEVRIVEGSSFQCENSDIHWIETNELPQIDLGNDTIVSPASSITLTGSSYYYVYNWSTQEQSLSITVDSIWGMPQRKIYVDVVDSNGCHNSDTILITFGPQSVNDIVPDFMKIYPVPVEDILYIEQSDYQLKELELYNIKGNLVRRILLSEERESIDLSDLPSGVYVVLGNEGIHLVKRIIKL
jgi:hypothetical protein